CSLPGCNRQCQGDVAPLHLKQPMWPDVHLVVQITGAPAARGSLALAGQPDELTIGHPGGDRDAHGVRAQLQRPVRLELRPLEVERARTAAESLLQVD